MVDSETANPSATAPDEATGGVPDAAVVSLADAVSHALDSTTATGSSSNPLGPPPAPLPQGWIRKESLSQPGYYYYYNMDSGVSQWHSPILPQEESLAAASNEEDAHEEVDHPRPQEAMIKATESAAGSDSSYTSERKKRSLEDESSNDKAEPSKRPKTSSSSSSSGKPSKVRILHILKKHKDSRRPSSWRQPKITATKEEATEELKGLIEILQEEIGEDQRATFEELARTESDCSSAKRGGDLGFFGPKKMQPAFEEASFALKIGELSGIVETSSGVHVLLRIG